MTWLEMADRVQSSSMRPFEEDATYELAGGQPVAVRGVFDEEHEFLDVGGTVEISSQSAPVFDIQEKNLPAGYARDDRITVRGTLFRVVDIQPDGHGVISLILAEQ